jgi:hypothetical protein
MLPCHAAVLVRATTALFQFALAAALGRLLDEPVDWASGEQALARPQDTRSATRAHTNETL